jgi:hypothetical protein
MITDGAKKYDCGDLLSLGPTDQHSIQIFVTQARATIMTSVRPTWTVTPAQEAE